MNKTNIVINLILVLFIILFLHQEYKSYIFKQFYQRDHQFEAPFGTSVRGSDPVQADKQSVLRAPTNKKNIFHTFAKNAQVYAIGVYESDAALYSLGERSIRFQTCMQNKNKITAEVREKCESYANEAKNPGDNSVRIHISNFYPKVLFLTAEQAVTWKIEGHTTNLRMIFISGDAAAQIQGNLENIPIYTSTQHQTYCKNCEEVDLGFYGLFAEEDHSIQNGKPSKTLRNISSELFGHDHIIFQGGKQGHEYIIQ